MLNRIKPFVAYLVVISFLAVVVCPANVWAFGGNNLVNSVPKFYFASGADCDAAIKSRTADFYQPTYFTMFKEVGAGEELRTLESDQCFRMLTVKGYRWVAQREGTKVVVVIKKGEAPRVVRRYDCGNPITDTYHKPEPEPEPVKPIPQETPKEKPCPVGTYKSEETGVCIREVPGEAPPPIDNTCVPGPVQVFFQHHEERKGFIPADIIRQKEPDAAKAAKILSLINTGANYKVTSMVLMTDGCNFGVSVHSVKEKKSWVKWWMIPAAFAGGFLLGYYIRKKGCKDCKVTTPVKSTPTTGSPTPQRPRRF